MILNDVFYQFLFPGAQIFIYLELPGEEERYARKQLSAEEVEKTIEYTTNLLWFYGDENRFNWTYDEYMETVCSHEYI